ncbi:condensation domain-containing protein [Pseudomonas sp. NA13]
MFGETTLGQWALALQGFLNEPAPTAEASTVQANLNQGHQSFAQRRLWFLRQLNPDDTRHNLVLHLRLQGPLDIETLALRLNTLVERHGVLRTVYRDGVDGPQQQVLPATAVALTHHDLREQNEAQQQQALSEHLAHEHASPVDLQAGPLLRAQLLSRHEQQHDLLLTLHHIAFDGRSAQVLLAELAGSTDVGLPGQYLDFAQWEARYWSEQRIATEQDFWRTHLAGMPQTVELGGSGQAPGNTAWTSACPRPAANGWQHWPASKA